MMYVQPININVSPSHVAFGIVDFDYAFPQTDEEIYFYVLKDNLTHDGFNVTVLLKDAGACVSLVVRYLAYDVVYRTEVYRYGMQLAIEDFPTNNIEFPISKDNTPQTVDFRSTTYGFWKSQDNIFLMYFNGITVNNSYVSNSNGHSFGLKVERIGEKKE